ncbi:hypothetical protein GOBAR_AA23058 [Gossypium barbadense]|uniref:Uncharacterized protein n=1 Tax=Gossypium barbadense TaxID=3634 RepID=A0A2P5X2Q2_GOSBA|nr:hypothetical protein GOBAR_AA23058 [Gossypium barbadense]
MVESNDSIPLDAEKIYLGGKEHHVRTRCGSVSVIVYGDQDKPALITYPDLALNYMSCFQGLFFCPEAASLLLHNFCVYHISPPGHELGAAQICPSTSSYSADDLADQILEVLNFFRLGAVMCMGVTAGAYILTLFAIKYRERVLGLILVSPLCKAPSWTEWFYNKVMSNLLYFYGMCGLLKEILLQRYFSKEVRGNAEVPESDIVQACRRLLDERYGSNVMRFLQAINVQACGSMVTEEQPHAMLIPMEYFFMRYGLYRPCPLSDSPRSPLSPSCISPELLSPESMGLKLKPIKTRVSLERPDLTSGLKRLRCRTLIFVGDSSPFHSEALYMTSKLNRRFSALVEVSTNYVL